MTARTAIEALYPQRREAGPPDGFDELREAIESLIPTQQGKAPSSARLGYLLRRFRKRVVGGRWFETAPARAGVVRWQVEDGEDGSNPSRGSSNYRGGEWEKSSQAHHPHHDGVTS
jgi:hypothetical protein